MKGVYKEMHKSLGGSSFGSSLVHSSVDSSKKPQTLYLSYFGACQGVGLSPSRKVFFICLSICAQGYLKHHELVFLVPCE